MERLTVTRPPSADERSSFPAELRAALARREPAALAAFFDAFFEPVFAYVHRLVGARWAEDLVQEIFVRVYERLETYDHEREPRPWLFSIATNQVRMHWRRAGVRDAVRERDVDADSALARAEGGPDAPPLGLERRETAERLRASVRALPEDLRIVVVLRAYEGLPYPEIGRALDVSTVAVRKRYSRALGLLREALREPDVDQARGTR